MAMETLRVLSEMLQDTLRLAKDDTVLREIVRDARHNPATGPMVAPKPEPKMSLAEQAKARAEAEARAEYARELRELNEWIRSRSRPFSAEAIVQMQRELLAKHFGQGGPQP